MNYCYNVSCLNNGICRPLFLDYKCECSPGIYSGRHCEHTETYIIVRQYVSKSFGSVAITVICSVVIFVVTLDVLKYAFHIDVAHHERERTRQKRIQRKRKAALSKQTRIAYHFMYVNKSPLAEQSV
jgi:hypothetical protein